MSSARKPGNSILVIHVSAHRESDTRKYITFTFARTVHTYLDLNDYHIDRYNYDSAYSSGDRFKEVMDMILRHETIVFSTPVYWYAMSGLMKVLFDRFTDIVTIDKPLGKQLHGKKVAMAAKAAFIRVLSTG